MAFHMVSGNTMGHEHQHGLGWMHKLPTSTWPLASAWPVDNIMSSSWPQALSQTTDILTTLGSNTGLEGISSCLLRKG